MCELSPVEEVGEELHGVGAEDGDVAVGCWNGVGRDGLRGGVVVACLDVALVYFAHDGIFFDIEDVE